MARILVLDDDGMILKVLAAVLTRAGHEVVCARDGREGLALYTKARADIVITDILMPEKDGLELIRELKHRDPTVRVIAMSGGGLHGIDHLRVAGLLGSVRQLAKPFDRVKLLEAVESALADGPLP